MLSLVFADVLFDGVFYDGSPPYVVLDDALLDFPFGRPFFDRYRLGFSVFSSRPFRAPPHRRIFGIV
jgi:hypothetical protein